MTSIEPHYTDENVTLYAGDCLDVLASLPDASIDSVVTDPPYGIGFMGKEWDGPAIRDAAARDRTTRRSLGPSSDSRPGRAAPRSSSAYGNEAIIAGPVRGGAEFQRWCEQWARECLRILKPGGHLLAFGGPRTWHRLTAGVEDAGFEIRDSIAWLYGSGFPKSLDVSKAIDKRPGVSQHSEFARHLAERRAAAGLSRADVSERVVGTRSGACWNWEHHQFPEAKWWPALHDLLNLDGEKWDAVIAEADRETIGTRDGTRLAVAPGQGSDRSATQLDVTAPATDAAKQWQGWGTALKPAFEPIVVARKPFRGSVAANVVATGVGALNIDACRVGTESTRRNNAEMGYHGGNLAAEYQTGSDAGRWPPNVALDETMAEQLDEQSGTLTSGANPTRRRSDKLRNVYGEFVGQKECVAHRGADSGGASRFFPVFRYTAKAATAERPTAGGIVHPTVKPLDLMRWLIRLVTPPHGHVLDPFAGSGTTAEACVHEHMRCTTIEREVTYLPLIVARLSKPLHVGFDFDEAVPDPSTGVIPNVD